jgi:adenylosuccinate synthase
MTSKKAAVVIGMNYGDEGKGHITNFLSDEDTLNIRFNGGAQAAHSVCLADGRSYTFRQFGAGSLRGARTLLARNFIFNPFFFAAEWQGLSKIIKLREIFVDPRCIVTTPYDMLINEFNCKYKNKHDSTGIGINETVERSQFNQLRLTVKDLAEKKDSDILVILKRIEREYVPWRLGILRVPFSLYLDDCKKKIKGFDELNNQYIGLSNEMKRCIVVWPDDNLIDRFLAKDEKRHIVFEGAQGFRLDQNRTELMPYLTRSNTGLQNVFKVLSTVKTQIDAQIFLVSRAYLTRHGDGPVLNEAAMKEYKIDESTNPENPYQGKMRYGYLDKFWYNKAFVEISDYISAYTPTCIQAIRVNSAITCLDQCPGEKIIYYSDYYNQLMNGSIKDFPHIKIVSRGITEKDCYFI